MPRSQIISASITDGTIVNTDVADSTLTTTKLATPNLGRRNLVINGAMQVAQRGTNFTGLGGTSGVYTIDRYRFGFTMNNGRLTITQSTDTPNGFGNSLKADITTAESSLNSASASAISQFFEGQDVQQFKKGTSDAEQYTLSFHVKSNVTGTYIVELFDQDNTRQVSKSYTIDSANTWEKKTLTFPADTTGAFDNDNAHSLSVQWFLASGTDRASGTLNTSWASSTNANRAVGQANLFSSTDNEWYITGVQLEVANEATPFEHRSFGEELTLCSRYFFVLAKGSDLTNENVGNAFGHSSSQMECVVRYGPGSGMRVAPTLDHPSGTNYYEVLNDSENAQFNSLQYYNPTKRSALIYRNSIGVTANGNYRFVLNNASAHIYFDAEL